VCLSHKAIEDLYSIDIDGKQCTVFIVLALNAIVLNGKDLHTRVSVGKQSSAIVYLARWRVAQNMKELNKRI